MTQDYLRWVADSTKTTWWHDSAEPNELAVGLERGAVGVTTNPFLAALALSRHREQWSDEIRAVFAEGLEPEERAGALMGIAVRHAAKQVYGEFENSKKEMGYVCAQVNPARAANREAMLRMARRFSRWAPNIAVKLPATAAGLDVLEDCTAEGITCTLTVSFTLPQVLATAERYRKGIERAASNRVEPGKCFSVIMIGRLDDYLREVAHDRQAGVTEEDIRQAGLAVTKRACSLYRERGYETVIIVAALRGTYHLTELAGAEVTMSIAPSYQEQLVSPDLPHEERMDVPIDEDVIERLATLPEFIQAYEPEGMKPPEFITYGVTQKTLAQFYESGWKLLENFEDV
ncbi:MAG: transaldolase family protein [Planctomycetes bacterium]|nr:transaldolase family protein [Planctomycetota bacterium]